jgi:hypothetical protein
MLWGPRRCCSIGWWRISVRSNLRGTW